MKGITEDHYESMKDQCKKISAFQFIRIDRESPAFML